MRRGEAGRGRGLDSIKRGSNINKNLHVWRGLTCGIWQYFGSRLERTLAPRHAFLASLGLPHGPALLLLSGDAAAAARRPPVLSLTLRQLLTKRSAADFAALCTEALVAGGSSAGGRSRVAAADVKAFEECFGRGLLAASRREGNQWPQDVNGPPAAGPPVADPPASGPPTPGPAPDPAAPAAPLVAVAPHAMVTLLINHGADPFERDRRGVSLVHHACGAGQWQCAEALAEVGRRGFG